MLEVSVVRRTRDYFLETWCTTRDCRPALYLLRQWGPWNLFMCHLCRHCTITIPYHAFINIFSDPFWQEVVYMFILSGVVTTLP